MRKPKLLDLFCGAGGCSVGMNGIIETSRDHRNQPVHILRHTHDLCGEYPEPLYSVGFANRHGERVYTGLMGFSEARKERERRTR